MAEIINDAEIKAVEDLTDKFNRLGNVLDTIIAKGAENDTVIEQAKAVTELSKRIAHLEKNQEKLVDENKKLKTAQEKTTKSTKDQEEAMEALNDRTGGVIGRVKEFGKQLGALAKNPFILGLSVIIAGLAALAAAFRTFTTTVGEGENALDRHKTSWNQFFNVLKVNFADLGRSVSEWFDKMGGSKSFINGMLSSMQIMFPFMSNWINKVRNDFNRTEEDAQKLTAAIQNLNDRIVINTIESARAQRDMNKTLLEFRDRYNNTTQERIDLVQKVIDLQEEQMRKDVEVAKARAEATLLEIGLVHNLTAEETKRLTQAERFAKFTGEENKRIAEAYANALKVEAQALQAMRQNLLRMNTERDKLRQENLRKANLAAQQEIREMENAVQTQIDIIKDQATIGNITVEEAEKRILETRKKYLAQQINTQIAVTEKLLQLEELSAEERAQIEQRLFDLKSQLVDAYYQQIEDKAKISFADIVAMYTDFTNSLGDLFTSMTDRRLQEIDMEEKRLEKMYNRELELAGNNDEAKAEIEKRAEKRREQLEKQRVAAQRKAAIFDKAVSATQAAIQTSLAVIRMLANPGGPVGVAMSIAAGITGALQVAAILSRPIPQYKDGGRTIADVVLAGEEGVEMYRTPSGEVGFTPNGPTIMRLPVGTEIKSHRETMKELAANGITGITDFAGTGDDVQWALYSKLNSIETTIKNKREVHYNWTRKGLEKAFKNGESRTYWMDNFFN